MIKVQVWLNEGEDNFFGFHNKFANMPRLRKAIEFELTTPSIEYDTGGAPVGILHRVYEQLNVGGDLVPAERWTTEYRANRNRSLSVGDVVVIEDTKYSVDSVGFSEISDFDFQEAVADWIKHGSFRS